MSWHPTARAVSLVFCVGVGAYLLHVALMSPLAVWVASAVRGVESLALRLVLGALVLDLSKAVPLAPAAWLIGRITALPPWAAALGLVLVCFGCDAAISALLQQGPWLWAQPAVLALRLASAALLVWLLGLLVRRARRHRSQGAD